MILPGAAYTEKDGLYVNTEGRVQAGVQAAFPPGQAREDWRIIRALSERLGHRLEYDSLGDLRRGPGGRAPGLRRARPAHSRPNGGRSEPGGPVEATPFGSAITNFYMTDPISRCSAVMAECTEVFGIGEAA